MMALRLSANIGFLWPDRPLLERIDAAAAAGFRAIEMHWPYDTPAAEVRAACERHGLTIVGINTVPGDRARGDFGLAAVPGREQEFREGLEQAANYARAIGAGSVHVMAGTVLDDARERAGEVLVENLSAAAASAPDLTLLLEPINQRDAPGYFYSTVGEAVGVIDTVGAANLRLMFDVYHAGVSEGDILTKLERHLPVIGHVQIAAVPSRAEPDEGEINYPAIFSALSELGYAGWIGCEYKPRGETDEGLVWMERLGVTFSPD